MVNQTYTKRHYSGDTVTKTVCVTCGFNENVVGELTGYVVKKTCDGCGRFGDNRALVKVPKGV